MSVIFGVLRDRGSNTSDGELRVLATATERYGLDGLSIRSIGEVGMGFQANCTHLRSTLESQPVHDLLGNMLTFDGRLDNYEELCTRLDMRCSEATDSQIILSAFERWGENCFSYFVGDWALALWSSKYHSLYLARDHAGARTLYFERRSGDILWSTYLETFLIGHTLRELDESYAACYLASQPLRDLTPYKNVTAVTPAHYFVFQETTTVKKAHWNWMAKDLIRYTTDAEYEEHFLSLFHCAVKRRTGAGSPILAHLSGGMDSTAIVCMSDLIRRSEGARTEDLLDTISYYDDTEPHWDDRTYFSIVERCRGKIGTHVDVSAYARTFEPVARSEGFYGVPGADRSSLQAEHELHDLAVRRGFRVILSGIGGDELLGGVPIGTPELTDYLVAGRLSTLIRVGIAWCVSTRTPLLHLLLNTVRSLLDLYYRRGSTRVAALPPWLTSHLIVAVESRASQFLPVCPSLLLRPSAIESGHTWWKLLETMPHQTPAYTVRYEYRYPYLDRDLVDFLLRVPREQLVRPGRRRSLMRRAMKSIVPDEVLERPRKGYLSRSPALSLLGRRHQIEATWKDSLLSAHGFADSYALIEHLDSIASNEMAMWVAPLTRAALFEIWLRALHGTA